MQTTARPPAELHPQQESPASRRRSHLPRRISQLRSPSAKRRNRQARFYWTPLEQIGAHRDSRELRHAPKVQDLFGCEVFQAHLLEASQVVSVDAVRPQFRKFLGAKVIPLAGRFGNEGARHSVR